MRLIDLSYNAVQAYLTHKANQDPLFFTQMEKVKAVFFAADIGSFVWSTCALMRDFEWKHVPSNQGKAFAILIVSYVGLAALGIYLVKKAFEISEDTGLENVTFTRPALEKFKQILYAARITTNVGLLFFTNGGLISFISIGLEVCGLIGVTQRKWLQFKKTVEITNPDLARHASQISLTYKFLVQSLYNKTPETCSICLEDDPEMDVYFCHNHTFHAHCITNMIHHKVNSFTNGLQVVNRNVNETRHHRNGFYTHSTYSVNYPIQMPLANAPHCPNCRMQPTHNDYTIEINDRTHGWSGTTINWINQN